MSEVEQRAHHWLVREVTHLHETVVVVPCSEHESRFALQQRFKQCVIVSHVIFKIRILNEDEVPGGMIQAGANGMPLPLRSFLKYYFDTGVVLILQHEVPG